MKILAFSMQSLVFAMGLSCGAASFAQVPAQPTRVVLQGYDPVAYFTENKPVKGSANIGLEFDEARYFFSSANNRQAFSKDPDRYIPQFAGFCTAGISKGMKAEANPEIFMIVNGKLYTFSSMKAKEAAQADPTLIARAEKNWKEGKK